MRPTNLVTAFRAAAPIFLQGPIAGGLVLLAAGAENRGGVVRRRPFKFTFVR
jgi:hypothetical protein